MKKIVYHIDILTLQLQGQETGIWILFLKHASINNIMQEGWGLPDIVIVVAGVFYREILFSVAISNLYPSK